MIQPETTAGRFKFYEKRRAKRNEATFVDKDGILNIPMKGGFVALVDEKHKDLVLQFVWYPARSKNTVYAKADVPQRLKEEFAERTVWLHRLILNVGPKTFVDHKDRNGLNCTGGNIRPATKSQNAVNRPLMKNKSGFKGVYRCGRKWISKLQFERKEIYLGLFKSREEAALAYNQAALQHFGEFAVLNEGCL